MNKTLLRCAALILCISLMIVPCFGASYGTVVNYTSVKFPGASSANSVSGQYILVQAEDFLPYICLISQYSAEFERYFTNNIYDLALIRFNNSTSADYVVPVMRVGTAQPISSAPSTIQVNGRLIAWDGVNDPSFSAIDFPFNNSKLVSDVNFGNRTASYLLGCDTNSRVIACSNDNGEYAMIENIKNTISIISSNLVAILDDQDMVENHLTTLVNAILNKQGDNNLTEISNKLTLINNNLSQIKTSIDSISDDTSSMIDDYFSVYFPQFDSDLDSICTQLQYFYQSFQQYMASIDSHLQSIDENIQDIHDEMSGEALKDYSVVGSDGQSKSFWQVIKSSVGWMMTPFGRFISMIMDGTRIFNGSTQGWVILFNITEATETYDPERITP